MCTGNGPDQDTSLNVSIIDHNKYDDGDDDEEERTTAMMMRVIGECEGQWVNTLGSSLLSTSLRHSTLLMEIHSWSLKKENTLDTNVVQVVIE